MKDPIEQAIDMVIGEAVPSLEDPIFKGEINELGDFILAGNLPKAIDAVKNLIKKVQKFGQGISPKMFGEATLILPDDMVFQAEMNDLRDFILTGKEQNAITMLRKLINRASKL